MNSLTPQEKCRLITRAGLGAAVLDGVPTAVLDKWASRRVENEHRFVVGLVDLETGWIELPAGEIKYLMDGCEQ